MDDPSLEFISFLGLIRKIILPFHRLILQEKIRQTGELFLLPNNET